MTKFTKLTGLWPNKRGNGFNGRLRDAITLPADARLMVLEVRESDRKERGPTHELVWAVEDEATHGERRDASERHVRPAEARAAVEMQRPPSRPAAARDMGLDDEIPF